MLETLISSLLSLRYYILLSLILIHYLSNYYKLGLHRYPGPLWAKFTNLWRFIDVSGRRPEVTHIALHRKYGDVVRLGPNVLSFADPKAIKGIYGLNKGFVKSEFYPVQMALSKGQPLPSLFSARDETFHANLRRSVNSAFSMSALVQYEPMVDSTTALFLDQTDRLFASQDRICDFSRWLQFYAFDVIGSITYSRRHGFVDRNEDVEGIVESLGAIFDYSGPIGQMPWLDYVFWKNPFLHLLAKLGIRENSTPVARFAVARMQERLLSTTTTAQDSVSTNGTAKSNTSKQQQQPQKHSQTDLLSMFLQAQKARPEFMTDKRVLTMATSMAFAGSETTAISLAAVFYHLLKNPTCLRKLLHELDTAVENGTIANRANGLVSWKESQTLTYLDACIKEAFRMHPSAGLPLERIVPPAGAEIAGYNIPAGTIVGCSAWVIHRRPEIFGADVDVYRPERWLVGDEVSEDGSDGAADEEKLRQQQARLKEMNACMFHFGAGARTCIGKNISLMEVYKLVPSFLRRFEVHFADPSDTWKLHNAWFVRQLNFRVKFRAKKIEGATS